MFTVDELSIISLYADNTNDRDMLIYSLKDILPYVKDQHMADIITSTIGKAQNISVNEFAALDLTETLRDNDPADTTT